MGCAAESGISSEGEKRSRALWILADLGMIHVHGPRELRSLAVQMALANSACTRLSGRPLVAVAPLKGASLEALERSMGRAGPEVLVAPLERVLDAAGARRVIYLDPYGEKDLSEEELEWAEAFVVGGIVDRTPAKRATTVLRTSTLPWAPSRRISLRGSRIGVPDEINSIVEIVLRARSLGSIEKAIKAVQPRRDAAARASVELGRLFRRGGLGDLVKAYEGLAEWLNLTPVDMLRALKRAGLEDLAAEWAKIAGLGRRPCGSC